MDSPPRDSDEIWLKCAIVSGDEAAWRILFERSFQSLYAYVYYRTGRCTHSTDELVQDVWLVAVRQIRTFDPTRGSFEAWVRGIADNLLRNERRRCWRRLAKTAINMSDADIEAVPEQPQVNRESSELAESIALALTELPGNYQNVLRAKYEEELSVAQIADRWNVTCKSVESLLSRARAAFREVFRRHRGESPGQPQ